MTKFSDKNSKCNNSSVLAQPLVGGGGGEGGTVPHCLASYPGLRREGLVHTVVRMRVNLTNFRLKPEILLFLRVTNTFEFHKPHATSTTMARFSSPCFSYLVSYALRKLQMTSISLRVEQRYSMEAVYNGHDAFVWLSTGNEWKESVRSSSIKPYR